MCRFLIRTYMQVLKTEYLILSSFLIFIGLNVNLKFKTKQTSTAKTKILMSMHDLKK